MQVFTTTLTSGTLQLNREDGAMIISVQSNESSSCLITGGLPFKGVLPTPITLNAGQIWNYASVTASSPLDGITVTWVSGNIDIVVGF